LVRRDFIEVLRLFDPNDAVGVFRDLARHLSDTEYWSLLGQVWIRIDSPAAHVRSLRRFLTSRRPERETIMSHADRADLATMPDPIRVHRGCLSRDRGWSWTINEDRAHWFAWDRVRRHGGPDRRGVVLSGFVVKGDVIAFLDQRNEAEIIVDPSNVQGVTVVEADLDRGERYNAVLSLIEISRMETFLGVGD
jgi:hypothetical protein